MARLLSEVLGKASGFDPFHITKDGGFRMSHVQGCVAEFSQPRYSHQTTVPEDVVAYIRRKGLGRLATMKIAHEFPVRFRRLKDGAEVEVIATSFAIDVVKGSGNRFRKIGFFFSGSIVYGCYLPLDDLVRLASFLHDAGANIVLDFPPWFNDASFMPLIEKIKPSSRRPGDEDARFFGF